MSIFIKILIICERNMHTGLSFSESLQPNKYLKSCSPKGSLLDTTILLISIWFIEVGLLF